MQPPTLTAISTCRSTISNP